MDWYIDGKYVPMIRIDGGPVFTLIPYDEARRIVDAVHDLCDAYEAKQREQL